MEQNSSCLRLYRNEPIFRLRCHDNDSHELYLFGYDRNDRRGWVSIRFTDFMHSLFFHSTSIYIYPYIDICFSILCCNTQIVHKLWIKWQYDANWQRSWIGFDSHSCTSTFTSSALQMNWLYFDICFSLSRSLSLFFATLGRYFYFVIGTGTYFWRFTHAKWLSKLLPKVLFWINTLIYVIHGIGWISL